jgi:hypothetical protein
MIRGVFFNLFSYLVRFFCLTIIISFIGFVTSSSSNKEKKSFFEENPIEAPVSSSNFNNYNYWYDHLYTKRSYSGTFSVRKNDYYNSRSYKNKDASNVDSYAEFYANLIVKDADRLDLVMDELEKIYRTKNLTDRQFINVVVAFVQDIPYSLLTASDCSNHRSSEYSCYSNITGGLYSPVEFMKNFHGDCDTRTVFLYTVLSSFGYDVIILNSEFYKHSILGVRLTSSGKYKTVYGKRYYTWETTAEGYKLGMMPAECSNMYYWDVAIHSLKSL